MYFDLEDAVIEKKKKKKNNHIGTHIQTLYF